MRMGLQPNGRLDADRGDGELDLRAIGQALWRKKWRILLPTLAVAALTFVAVQFLAPQYRSEARILYDSRENIFLRPEVERSVTDRSQADEQAVTSQVQLVLSRDLAREVIKKLKLGELPEFDPVLRGVSPVRMVLGLLGLAKDPLRMTPEERVLEAYYDRLNVFSVEKSRVITVEFRSGNPELAARVANTIADTYLVFQQVAKQEQARSASQWLSGEIENLRRTVAEAEAKAESFRARSNLFVGTNNTNLSNQQLGEFSSQFAAARAQKADAETKARLIREMLRSGRPIEVSEVTNSELMRRLAEQRVALRTQLAEQSATLLDGHPRIKELRAQIGDMDRQMRDEADKISRSLENDAKIAGARVDTLSAGLDQLKRQAASTNEQDVQLRALEREAKAQRDLLESYLAKYREATARENIDAAPADARIISRATVSNTPYFPKKLPIVLIASLATFMLSAGFLATSELFKGMGATSAPAAPVTEPEAAAAPADHVAVFEPNRVRSVRDVGNFADTHPALAVPVSTIEDFARSLKGTGEAGRRIALFGSSHNAGAGMTALTLARALAKDGRVVLVDLSFGAPSLSSVSTDPNAPGITDLTNGTASFGQIITRDQLSRVHLVGMGRMPGDPATILASPNLTTMIDALARTYDHVVIDAGTVADAVPDRLVRLASRAVLVAPGAPSEEATKSAREQLIKGGFADVTVLAGRPKGPEVEAA